MSRFTSTIPQATSSGAVADGIQANALTVTGAVVGGVGLAGATFVGAVALPVPVVGLTAIGAGCIYAGQRMADGKPVIPFTGSDAPAVTEAPATEASA